MKRGHCDLCAARKRIIKLMAATFLSLLAGALAHDYLRALDADLALFIGCLGLSGAGISLYKYVGAVKHFEKVKQNHRNHH